MTSHQRKEKGAEKRARERSQHQNDVTWSIPQGRGHTAPAKPAWLLSRQQGTRKQHDVTWGLIALKLNMKTLYTDTATWKGQQTCRNTTGNHPHQENNLESDRMLQSSKQRRRSSTSSRKLILKLTFNLWSQEFQYKIYLEVFFYDQAFC